jgi:hypothetical protein
LLWHLEIRKATSENARIKAYARGKNAGAQFIAPNQVNEHFAAGA